MRKARIWIGLFVACVLGSIACSELTKPSYVPPGDTTQTDTTKGQG